MTQNQNRGAAMKPRQKVDLGTICEKAAEIIDILNTVPMREAANILKQVKLRFTLPDMVVDGTGRIVCQASANNAI